MTLGTGVSARWLAMARAGSADPDTDLNPVVNPALIAGLPSVSLAMMYARLYEASSAQTFVVGYPWTRRMVFAFAMHRAGSDSISEWDSTGVELGRSNFARYEGTLTGGYRFSPALSGGVTLRGVTAAAAGSRAAGGAADLGVSYLYDDFLGAGLKVENALGSKSLARHIRFGTTFRTPSGRFSVSADGQWIGSSARMADSIRWHVGGEAWAMKQLALRLGAETAGFSAGLGVNYRMFNLDYAAIRTDIGISHWVSFRLTSRILPAHGTKKKPPKPKPTAVPTAVPTPTAVVEQRRPTVQPTAIEKRETKPEPTESAVAPKPLVIPGFGDDSAAAPPKPQALAKPAGLTVARESDGSVVLSWSAVRSAVGYNVLLAALPWEPGRKLNSKPIPDTRVVLPAPEGGAAYLRAEAVDAAGTTSPPSDPAVAK